MYTQIIDNNLVAWAGYQFDGWNKEFPEIDYNDYQANPNKYIFDGEDIVLNPNYEEEQAQKEVERIAKLTMTSLDFINFLEACGLTLEEITAWLDKPENLRVKTQLQYCQNVYCGVACSLMPIEMSEITITADMVIYAFRKKYGEIVEEEPTNEVE